MNLEQYFKDRRVGLCDCNNFFVSCERFAHPEYMNVPVVVLSSNDGCVISRSNEVKALGIKMGAPYFQIKRFLADNNVKVFSSHMPLYLERSECVMDTLSEFTDTADQYSVDEAFFNLAIGAVADPVGYCRTIRREIWKRCKIPVSIGIAPTKTLAKIAAEYAKKHKETNGVFWCSRRFYKNEAWLASFETSDIWGIGGKTAQKLLCPWSVANAYQLTQLNDLWIKKNFGVNLLMTVWELRGNPAIHTTPKGAPPKSIQVSRTFGTPLKSFEELLDPILCFAASAARQLREYGRSARKLRVYIRNSPFSNDFFVRELEYEFPIPEQRDSVFLEKSTELLKSMYKYGPDYKKAGVCLCGLTDRAEAMQMTLFDEPDDKNDAAARAVDEVNRELGFFAIKSAALFKAPGEERNWLPKSEHGESPAGAAKDNRPIRFLSHAADTLRNA